MQSVKPELVEAMENYKVCPLMKISAIPIKLFCRKDTEPLYHSFMYSLVSLLSRIYPLPAMHSLIVTLYVMEYLISINQRLSFTVSKHLCSLFEEILVSLGSKLYQKHTIGLLSIQKISFTLF